MSADLLAAVRVCAEDCHRGPNFAGDPQYDWPMRRVGFVTSREDPDLTADDRLAIAPLAARGREVVPVRWDAFDAAGLHAVVLRSCWDYHRAPDAFRAWLESLAALSIPVCNPPAIAAWNLHKGYLLELGVAIPRTTIVRRGEPLREPLDAAELVVKPAISLNGHDTVRTTAAEVASVVARLARHGDVLVQEYVPEIERTGELSLVFVGGGFSHAIRKRPAAGEFRVQAEHGGRRERTQASGAHIAWAERLLSGVTADLLFARVDVVERGDELVLMELELIDPMLFLGYADGAPERFADAVAAIA